MAQNDVEKDPLADSSIDREDITPRAREPQDHLARPGWGAWDPDGPLVQTPDNTVKGVVDVASPDAHEIDITGGRSDPSDDEEPLADPASREFRREEYDPGLIRPVTEAPPSEH